MILTSKKIYHDNDSTMIVYEYQGCLYVAHRYSSQSVEISAMYTTEVEAILSVTTSFYNKIRMANATN